MTLALNRFFANPSALHDFGYGVKKEMEARRKQIAGFAGASPDQLIFTSGGTESNNGAIHSHLLNQTKDKKTLLTTAIDHPSLRHSLEALKGDYRLVYLPLDEGGHIQVEALKDYLSEDVALVAYPHVHNELGAINPIEEINRVIKAYSKDIYIHVDGVQALGKIEVNFSRSGADSYSFSGHKFHGPKGIGGLFLKEPARFKAFHQGGGQEGGHRSGTENIPGVFGLAKALEELEGQVDKNYAHVASLKARAIDLIDKKIDQVKINSKDPSSPYILHLSIKDIKGEVILHMLEEKEIYISTGSACSSNAQEKSPVLDLLKLDRGYQEGALRICFSKENTLEEIDYFVEVLSQSVEDVRSLVRG